MKDRTTSRNHAARPHHSTPAMNKPTIFVSAVSHELRSARERIAGILRRRGFEVLYQPEFGTASGDLRPMLRKKLAPCHGLIQLIGDAYGAEAAVLLAWLLYARRGAAPAAVR